LCCWDYFDLYVITNFWNIAFNRKMGDKNAKKVCEKNGGNGTVEVCSESERVTYGSIFITNLE